MSSELLFALLVTGSTIILGGLLGKGKAILTLVSGMGVIWLNAGLGWTAGRWNGIFTFTTPSLIVLIAGFLALPPYVLPVAPLRWKWPTLCAVLYNLLWLVSVRSGLVEMDVMGMFVFLQGLLLVFRPAFPLENVQSLGASILITAYGLIMAGALSCLADFELNNSHNLVILIQGFLVLSSYSLPVTGPKRRRLWIFLLFYGLPYSVAMYLGKIDTTLTNVLILMLGEAAILRYALLNEDDIAHYLKKPESRWRRAFQQYIQKIQAPEDSTIEVFGQAVALTTDLMAATAILITYLLIWISDLNMRETATPWFNALSISIGIVAIFMPIFVKPSNNWAAFKATITYNLGTNYPYLAVPIRELVPRAKGNAFAKLLAGPGIVLTNADHAVVIYGAGSFARVSPPGLTFTHWAEEVNEIVDLRPQVRSTSSIVVKTKDGVDVKVEGVTPFRIQTDGREPELGRSFPYNEEAIHKAVHAQRVNQDPGNAQGWDKLLPQVAERAVRDIVAQFTLDELSSLFEPYREPAAEISARMRDRVREKAEGWGLELLAGGIGKVDPPPEVIEQRIQYWKAHWERKISALEAEAEAEERRRIEIARAEAQMEMILRITEGLEQIPDSDPGRRREVVVLRLLEALGATEADYQGLTSLVESLREQIRTSSGGSMPPVPRLGADE